MLGATSCFSHEISQVRFSIRVPGALGNGSKPGMWKDKSYISPGLEFFLSFQHQNSCPEMFLKHPLRAIRTGENTFATKDDHDNLDFAPGGSRTS